MILLTLSCSQTGDYQLETFDSNSKALKEPGEAPIALKEFYQGAFTSWQDQLEFAKNEGGAFGILHANGLRLIDYSISKNDLEWLTNIKISENDFSPITVVDTAIVGNFTIEKIGSRKEIAILKNLRKSEILNSVSFDNTLKLIEINWLHQGKFYKSNCVVSDAIGAVIYDDFLSNISFTTSISRNEGHLASFSATAKNSENSGDGTLSYYFSKSITKRTWTNSIGAQATATLTVYGTKNAQGKKSMTTYSSRNYETANAGYRAVAATSIGSFTPGINGHCAFGYAIGVSDGATMTLNGSGTGISISVPGGALGQSGSEYLTTGSLN
ncbi:hypothetical protein GCM10017764_18520 [Sphingobacterium griseoflavum]|uniref:BACON domain-containing protein n=2 Tax=Sphingobacterium griseoflavum TaxID=1474952 RepID=A0ABQ3HXY9_9SPHI|nr:hypothetical protein GCM10017764_18520 [Sphingobacterium griseoflavum]